MFDWLAWLGRMENTKPLVLVLFFVAFVAIVAYVYTGSSRRERLESYKYIPFLDDDDQEPDPREKQRD
jgi:cbb3-type cytochrome oxidase subunit 3